jgi:tetratricopeptide (TPR) repeat protein
MPQSMFIDAIKNFDTCYKLYEKDNNLSEMCRAVITAATVYEESGNYERAFGLARKGLNLAIENNEDWFRRTVLTLIGTLFGDIEDYNTALAYCFQAAQNLKPEEYNGFNPRLLRVISELYSRRKQFDSARYYYSFFDTRFHLFSNRKVREGLRKGRKDCCRVLCQ